MVVLPLWIVHPPYGKACLLSLPPMILCALSWAAGAWWAWDKGFQVLMAVTLGGMPVRMILVLAWLWIVTTIPGVPIVVFVICMMWHWVLLSVPEFAMMLELGRQSQQWRARPRSDQPAAPANQSKDGGNLS